jgi:hypothetical protein
MRQTTLARLLPSVAIAARLPFQGGSFCLASVCLALLVLARPIQLNAGQATEYEAKAAFLLNFAKFAEWPLRVFSHPTAPLIVGVMGDDPFGKSLPKIMQGQTAKGRPIEVRYFRAEDDPGECHILFLSRSVAGQSREILQRLQGRPLMTVGEQDDFVHLGGVIGFTQSNKQVRFDVNTKAAEMAELKLSSKLLGVARRVIK